MLDVVLATAYLLVIVAAVIVMLSQIAEFVSDGVRARRHAEEAELNRQQQQVLELAYQLSQELRDEGLDARKAMLRAATEAAKQASSR